MVSLKNFLNEGRLSLVNFVSNNMFVVFNCNSSEHFVRNFPASKKFGDAIMGKFGNRKL